MDKVELKNIKGTFDYLPNEQILKNKIINKLSKVFESYGYLPLETTTLCYYDLLASKYAGGAEILKEVYKLEDQGKRNLENIQKKFEMLIQHEKIIVLEILVIGLFLIIQKPLYIKFAPKEKKDMVDL